MFLLLIIILIYISSTHVQVLYEEYFNRLYWEGTLIMSLKSQRTKLSSLDSRFHCSIIGTCLTLTELRKIYRKVKLFSKSTLSDYDLHHFFVGFARESSYENRRLQKYLDKKYQHVIRQFAKVRSVPVLQRMWQDALENGEVAGAYWALVTHPVVSDDLLDEVYGEIHMLSHLSSASARVDMLELSRLRQRTKELEKQMADMRTDTKNRLKEKDEIIRTLNDRLKTAAETEEKRQRVQTQREADEKTPIVEQLRKKTREFATKLTVEQALAKRMQKQAEQWKSSAKYAEERYFSLEQRLDQTCQERDGLEATLSNLLGMECPESRTESKDCPNKDLCGRCILLVGGRTSLSRHFSHLVEEYNGHFIHHDGGREEGHFKLESTLSKADAVLCPLDCISHEAMNKIKRYCSNNTKQLVMMPRASLSAFVNGLNEVVSL